MSLIGADDLEMDAALMDAGAVGKNRVRTADFPSMAGKKDGHMGVGDGLIWFFSRKNGGIVGLESDM